MPSIERDILTRICKITKVGGLSVAKPSEPISTSAKIHPEIIGPIRQLQGSRRTPGLDFEVHVLITPSTHFQIGDM